VAAVLREAAVHAQFAACFVSFSVTSSRRNIYTGHLLREGFRPVDDRVLRK